MTKACADAHDKMFRQPIIHVKAGLQVRIHGRSDGFIAWVIHFIIMIEIPCNTGANTIREIEPSFLSVDGNFGVSVQHIWFAKTFVPEIHEADPYTEFWFPVDPGIDRAGGYIPGIGYRE